MNAANRSFICQVVVSYPTRGKDGSYSIFLHNIIIFFSSRPNAHKMSTFLFKHRAINCAKFAFKPNNNQETQKHEPIIDSCRRDLLRNKPPRKSTLPLLLLLLPRNLCVRKHTCVLISTYNGEVLNLGPVFSPNFIHI